MGGGGSHISLIRTENTDALNTTCSSMNDTEKVGVCVRECVC